MRKTKIIATLGPASESPERMRLLVEAGVNIFRLNMSHAGHDWVRRIVRQIREVSAQLGTQVGILMDTQGPSIRTAERAEKIEITTGETFTFTIKGAPEPLGKSVQVSYDQFADDVQIGDLVLVDNGVIRLEAVSKTAHAVKCRALTDGVLGSRRRVNLPTVEVNLPALTEKDLADIELGLECGVDFIAQSFVRRAEDVLELRRLLEAKGKSQKIVAKIECQAAVRNREAIIDAADAVMVARGDLGVETPYEELPIVQRQLVKSCVQKIKPVIVATQLLESMIQNPMPTRAEITDVANAVYEQADAVMLSGETTVGEYPVECVKVLDRIATRTERSGNAGFSDKVLTQTDQQKVVSAAVHMADEVRATGICIFTRKGKLARMTAGLRPRYSPTFAFTQTDELARQLTLLFGIIPLRMDFGADLNQNIIDAERYLQRNGLVKAGDRVVMAADLNIGDQVSHAVHLRVIE